MDLATGDDPSIGESAGEVMEKKKMKYLSR